MSRDGSPRRLLGCILIVAGAFAGTGVLLTASKAGSQREKGLSECRKRLTALGEGFLRYRKDHAGELPGHDGARFVAALYGPDGFERPGVFFCPNGGVDEAFREETIRRGECDFLGRRNAGDERLAPDRIDEESGRIPLAGDRSVEHHYDVRNVLFADGHVAEVDEETFQRDYASQLDE